MKLIEVTSMYTIKNRTKSCGIGIALFSLFTTPAGAQIGATFDSSIEFKGSGDQGENIYSSTSIDLNTDTNITIEPEKQRNININTGSETHSKLDTSLKSESDIETKSESGTSNELNSGNTVGAEKDMALKVNAFGIAITSSKQVSSEEDLKVFSENASLQNKAIKQVRANSNNAKEPEVKVVYKHRGKFLGFIPVTVKSTTVVQARVSAETEVQSSISWWSFLVTGENYDKKTLETSIKNNAKIKTNARVGASAQAKAQIVEALLAELRLQVDTQPSKSVDVQ